MSKKFYQDLSLTLFLLLLFVSILALAGEFSRRDLLKENRELKLTLQTAK